LNRSSGVLAGIVASLAQAGIEFQSQKLQRATEGRGGWLTITGSGDSPNPAVLAERLNGTRGVEKLMRVIVDGEAVLAEGRPLEDQIQPGDLADLSAGSDTGFDESHEAPEPQPAPDPPREVHASTPDVEDLPILSEPEVVEDSPTEPEPESESESGPEPVRREATPKPVADSLEQDFAAALDAADESAEEDRPPEFVAEPTEESDFSDTLQGDAGATETSETSVGGEEDDNPAQVGAVLRRRRRRRR
jgi:hypothetical protein